MIKKIICPTDFSEAAVNGTEYAAKLAQTLDAEILFINVTRVSALEAVVSLTEGVNPRARENASEVLAQLKELAAEVGKIFNVTTDYESIVTDKSIADSIIAHNMEDTIVVIGTNGADSVYQQFFGSNSYRVVKKVTCPVLIIPQHFAYGTISKIVFAWGYNTENKFNFTALNDLIGPFKPQFVFLHVSRHGEDPGRDVYNSLREEINSILGPRPDVDFEQVFVGENTGPSETIDQYMKRSGADLLAINYHDRRMMELFTVDKTTMKLVESADYPVMVLKM